MRMLKWKPLMFLALVPLIACGEPAIEPTCMMNGFGVGTCRFTNTGTASGSVCGVVEVAPHPLWEVKLKEATQLLDARRLDDNKARAAWNAAKANRIDHDIDRTRKHLAEAGQKAHESYQAVAEMEGLLFPSIKSTVFCSGDVGSKSTVAVDFRVPQMRETCNPQAPLESAVAKQVLESLDGGWMGYCIFQFVPQGEAP